MTNIMMMRMKGYLKPNNLLVFFPQLRLYNYHFLGENQTKHMDFLLA